MCQIKKGLSPQKQIFMSEKKFPSLPLTDIYVEKNKSLRTENINICQFFLTVASQRHKYMPLLLEVFSHKFTNDFLFTAIYFAKAIIFKIKMKQIAVFVKVLKSAMPPPQKL